MEHFRKIWDQVHIREELLLGKQKDEEDRVSKEDITGNWQLQQ